MLWEAVCINITEYTPEKSRLLASTVVNVSVIRKVARSMKKYIQERSLMSVSNVESVFPELAS